MPVVHHNKEKCSHLCFYDWPLFCLAWLCLVPVEQVILINKKKREKEKVSAWGCVWSYWEQECKCVKEIPSDAKGSQVALQAAEASWNNCTGVLPLQKDFHFSNWKSNQIKSNLHFYSIFHNRIPRHFTLEVKSLKCLWTKQIRRACLEPRCKVWECSSSRRWHRLRGPYTMGPGSALPPGEDSQATPDPMGPQHADLDVRCKVLISHTT